MIEQSNNKNYNEIGKSLLTKELFEACMKYDLEKVKQLVVEGADVNGRDSFGNSPLHITLENRPVPIGIYSEAKDIMHDISEVLLAKGADVNAKDHYGRTPLHNAATSVWHDKKLYDLLLRNKADPNIQDNYGSTPLHSFTHNLAKRDTFDIFKLFIKNGANIKLTNKEGFTSVEFYEFEHDLKKFYIKSHAQKEKPVREGALSGLISKFKVNKSDERKM